MLILVILFITIIYILIVLFLVSSMDSCDKFEIPNFKNINKSETNNNIDIKE